MKKLLFLTLFCVSFSYGAAFNATMQWGLNPNGLDTNGGGFDPGVVSPGTNEAQNVTTGTAITCTLVTGTTATCSPAISATTHGPGNVIAFASGSGCNVQRQEILSQIAGTATFNATEGTTGNVCVGVIGGEFFTPQAAAAVFVAGNSLFFKTGTITVTALTSYTVNSIKTLCYSTVWGDHGTGCNWTTATNNIHNVEINSGNDQIYFTFENISFSTTAGTRTSSIGIYTGANSMFVIGGTFSGFTGTGVYAIGPGSGNAADVNISGAEFTNNCFGINVNGFGHYPTTIQFSNFHDNVLTGSCAGILMTGGTVQANGNNFTNNRAGIDRTGSFGSLILTNSTIAGNVIGVALDTNSGGFSSACNIFYNNSTAGVGGTATTSNAQYSNWNAYGSNGADYLSFLSAGPNDITGISNPFVNSGGNNWTLTSSTSLRGACTPTLLGSSTTTAYNIGAAQASNISVPQSTVYGQ